MPEVELQAVLLPGGRKTIIEWRPLPLPPVRCPLPPPPHKPAYDPELSAPSRRWTLREFFERYYVPEKLHGHDCPKNAPRHVRATDRHSTGSAHSAAPILNWTGLRARPEGVPSLAWGTLPCGIHREPSLAMYRHALYGRRSTKAKA